MESKTESLNANQEDTFVVEADDNLEMEKIETNW